MLLKSLKLVNARGQELEFPLEDISAGFFVKEILGLDPVKATLTSSAFANMDGEQYHSSRREIRNIILKLGLDPDYSAGSVYDLRNQLYQFLMPKTVVKLYFNLFDVFATGVATQNLDVMIEGRVESFDSTMFTNIPSVDVSILCYISEFTNVNPVVVESTTVSDGSHPDLVIPYTGTVETGVLFTMTLNRSMQQLIIGHTNPDGEFVTVDLARSLQSGDRVEISSVRGNKFAHLIRNHVRSTILYNLSPNSGWIELFPGDNVISIHSLGTPQPVTIEYHNKYGGL